MRKIAVEEHYCPKSYNDYLLSRSKAPRLEIIRDKEGGVKAYREWSQVGYTTLPLEKQDAKCQLGGQRLKDMDDVGIDMQVVSWPAGGLENMAETKAGKLARKMNDDISRAINKYPGRYAAFARVGLVNPEEGASELKRAVKTLGFKGAMIIPHINGEYIDARKYWPLYEMADDLGVPLYLHPGPPDPAASSQYAGYPELAGAMWGFAAMTGLAAMRLICSGVFDVYPDLKIILGHMGEALPYWMSRMDNRLFSLLKEDQTPRGEDGAPLYTPLAKVLKKPPSRYVQDNFYITTSGMMWQPVLQFVCAALGADKVLFATDYPHEDLLESVRAVQHAPIDGDSKEKIFHLNAERLLNL